MGVISTTATFWFCIQWFAQSKKLTRDLEVWNLTEEDRQIYEKFEEYVKLHTNVTRFQSDKELFDQFVTELKLFVRNCNYDRSEEIVIE